MLQVYCLGYVGETTEAFPPAKSGTGNTVLLTMQIALLKGNPTSFMPISVQRFQLEPGGGLSVKSR